MTQHDFTIIASGLNTAAADYEDRFFEAGCDDATLSFQRGLIILDFAREAESLSHAVVTAMRDVRAAGARIERVEPDPLVSLSDIAERSQLSRQAISLFAKGERGADFPPPAAKIMSGHPLWDWGVVANWLHCRTLIPIEMAVAARIIGQANVALLEKADFDEDLARRLSAIERSARA